MPRIHHHAEDQSVHLLADDRGMGNMLHLMDAAVVGPHRVDADIAGRRGDERQQQHDRINFRSELHILEQSVLPPVARAEPRRRQARHRSPGRACRYHSTPAGPLRHRGRSGVPFNLLTLSRRVFDAVPPRPRSGRSLTEQRIHRSRTAILVDRVAYSVPRRVAKFGPPPLALDAGLAQLERGAVLPVACGGCEFTPGTAERRMRCRFCQNHCP
jgi:hypothetical protein